MTAPTIEVLTDPPYVPAMPSGGGASSPSGPYTIQVTTVAANYLLISIGQCTFGNAGTVSITGAGLTFTKLVSVTGHYAGPSYDGSIQEVWGAPVSTPLTNATITITPTVGVDSCAATAIGLIGYAGLDTGGANIPGTAISYLNYPMGVTYSTSNASDLVLYFGYAESNVDYGAPSGFTETAFSSAVGSSRSAGVTVAQYAPGTTLSGVTTTSPIPADHFSFESSMIMLAFAGATTGDAGAAAITESADSVAGAGSVPATLTVPNVINLSEAIAESTIIGAGFTVGTISFAADVLIIAGNVDAQSPAGGTTALAGTNVNITVSTGRGSVVVPELVGLASPVAYTALESVGLGIGAVGDAYSATVPAGVVISQDVAAGTTVASGTLVGFVVSLGALPSTTLFNIEPTVISQYANSPTLLQWLANMNQYLDQSQNFANFLEYVWNVDTAVGFGLDIWGKIVNVGRLVRIPNTTKFVGFYIAGESQPSQDWTPAGDNRQNPPAGGAFYSGYNATQAYLLSDGAYRQLILAKAFANICTTTAPAINQILQNLYGAGAAWVSVTGLMAIAYNFNFTPTPVQLAILTQSGVVPTPPGVVATVVHP